MIIYNCLSAKRANKSRLIFLLDAIGDRKSRIYWKDCKSYFELKCSIYFGISCFTAWVETKCDAYLEIRWRQTKSESFNTVHCFNYQLDRACLEAKDPNVFNFKCFIVKTVCCDGQEKTIPSKWKPCYFIIIWQSSSQFFGWMEFGRELHGESK